MSISTLPDAVSRTCPSCAAPLVSARFCTACGAPLTPASEGPAPAVPPVPVQAGPPQLPVALAPQDVLPQPSTVPPWLDEHPTPVVRRPRTNGLAVLVLCALLLSGWAIARGVEQHTLSGTVLLIDTSTSSLDPGDTCFGRGGYDDVNAGAQVVVSDESGTTLSTARLSPGRFDGLGCVFSFELEDVTRAEFYALNVAGENRGELQYSYDELAGDHWSVELTLGRD